MTSTTLTLRISPDTKKRLERLARATSRTKSWLALRAIDEYVATQSWQIAEIEKGLREADAGDFATEAEVEGAFAKAAANSVGSGRGKKSGRRPRVHRGR